MVVQKELTLQTHSCGEMHDLTDAVARVVSESGVRTGIVQIFNVGSTAAIGAVEFAGLEAGPADAFAATDSTQPGLCARANLARR